MGKQLDKEGDHGNKSLEYHTKAAELGDMAAHFCLACLYYNGDGVEKDTKKAVYHFDRQQLVVILRLEAFLHFMKRSNAGATEQQNISSLLPISDVICHCKKSKTFLKL